MSLPQKILPLPVPVGVDPALSLALDAAVADITGQRCERYDEKGFVYQVIRDHALELARNRFYDLDVSKGKEEILTHLQWAVSSCTRYNFDKPKPRGMRYDPCVMERAEQLETYANARIEHMETDAIAREEIALKPLHDALGPESPFRIYLQRPAGVRSR